MEGVVRLMDRTPQQRWAGGYGSGGEGYVCVWVGWQRGVFDCRTSVEVEHD